MFEPNDSFDTATRTAFVAPTRPWMRTLCPSGALGASTRRCTARGRRSAGSTSTATTTGYGPASTIFSVPRITVSDTDESVNVVLYDAAQHELRRWSRVRNVSIEPPESSVCSFVVSGIKQTRYAIDIGMKVKKGILPGPAKPPQAPSRSSRRHHRCAECLRRRPAQHFARTRPVLARID